MRKPIDLTKFTNAVGKSLKITSGFNDPTEWVSTGNVLLNYLISGHWDNGLPLGKLSMLAGESGSGKSFIASGNIVRECQHQGITPIIIDTENALDEEWLQRLGVDTSPEALLRFSVSMINDVGKIMSIFIEDYKDAYGDLPMEEKPKFMFVIDSLGMLLTDTDVDQFVKGDMKGDFGRKPKQLTALVRNVMNKIGDCNIGVVVTNHTYASQDMFDPDDKISGGCLVAGTEIITDKGIKAIEDIQVGDMVLSDDNKFHEVLKTWYYEKTTYIIELEDGQMFECSPEHKFKVLRSDSHEWVEAKDITENDSVLSFTSIDDSTPKNIKVSTNTSNDEVKPVYDIQVKDTANYILKDGVISHNSGLIYGSSIVIASKKFNLKEDEDGNKVTDVTGIRVRFKIMKTRYGRPFETANCHIRFDSGLDKYSGLLDYLIRIGVIEKQGNRWKYINNDGEEMIEFRKNWTGDKLQRIIDEWDYEKYALISNRVMADDGVSEAIEDEILEAAVEATVHTDE